MLPAQLYTYIMLTLTGLLLMIITDIKNRGYMIYRTKSGFISFKYYDREKS